MKIAILTDGIFPFMIGGMQKHSHYLVRYLLKEGHEICLVHYVDHKSAKPSADDVKAALHLGKDAPLEIITLRFPAPGFMPGHYIKESYQQSRIVFDLLAKRWSEFDFIYAKGFAAWHLLHEKSKKKKLPPVGIKFHGYEMFQPSMGWKSKLQAWMLRGPVKWNNLNADYVFSYGGKITEIITDLGVSLNRIIEIPTGIEASWIRTAVTSSQDCIRFVFVGRFEHRKGVNELNAALQQLQPDARFAFHFVGPIPPSAKLKDARITYHGALNSIDALQQILDQCDVLVVPSHSEGMPNVIMEGMARGLAILATDVGAVNQLVGIDNGWLIAPRSSDEIRVTLQKIISSPTQDIDFKKQQSLDKVSHFTWEKIGKLTSDAISNRALGQ